MRLADRRRSSIVPSMPARWKSDKPISRQAFDARFSNEEACAQYLADRRWPDGFVCPSCGACKGWPLKRNRATWECSGCARQTSVTAGTVMHSSHLPLRTWCLAAHTLRANKSETIEWLKFTLEGVGERTHGYAFEDTDKFRCHKRVDIYPKERNMRLTPPSFIIFLISIICGVLALLPVAGIALVALPLSAFWLMTIAWGLLIIGVLFRGA